MAWGVKVMQVWLCALPLSRWWRIPLRARVNWKTQTKISKTLKTVQNSECFKTFKTFQNLVNIQKVQIIQNSWKITWITRIFENSGSNWSHQGDPFWNILERKNKQTKRRKAFQKMYKSKKNRCLPFRAIYFCTWLQWHDYACNVYDIWETMHLCIPVLQGFVIIETVSLAKEPIVNNHFQIHFAVTTASVF